jgi:hypothetical protein
LAETARRFAEDLDLEVDLTAEAKAGIDDIEAGHCRLMATREDLAAMASEVMARVRNRLAADKGCGWGS